MSMVICQECDDPIDSDEDCDCFGASTVRCKWCREALEIDEDDES